MINYIQSELFRARNSRLIKFIIFAGILIPALLLFPIYQESKTEALSLYNNLLNQYTYTFTIIMMPSAFFVSQLLLIYTKKNPHIYRLILSQGLTRDRLVLYDLISYNFLTIIVGVLAFLIALFYNNLFGYISYGSFVNGNEILFGNFIYIMIIQLLSNMVSFTLYTVLNSIPLTIAVNFLILAISSNNLTLTFKGNDLANKSILIKIIRCFSPYHIFETYFGDEILLLSQLSPLDIVKILAYSLIIITVSILISQAAFRKREL